MDAQAHTIASVLPTSNADPLLKPGLLSTAKSSSKNIVKIIQIVINKTGSKPVSKTARGMVFVTGLVKHCNKLYTWYLKQP